MSQFDKNMKIMVLSGDKENLITVIKCLKKLDFTKITHSDNGVEAIQKMVVDPVDFILCDQDIRFLKGWVFIKEMKNSDKIPNIPVILFGKANAPESEEIMKQYGVIQYLKFPISDSNLDFAIHSTLTLFNTSGTTENKFSKAKTALLHQNSTAVDLYQELRGLTKNSTRSSLGLAQAYVQNNEQEKASKVLQEVVATGDITPSTRIIGIKLALEQKNTENANQLSTSLLTEQDNIFYYSRCVDLFIEASEFMSAENYCVQAIEKDFLVPQFHTNLAKCKYGQDKYPDCINVLNEAEKKFGPSYEISNIRGVCYKKTGSFTEAIESYEEALQLEPMNPKAYFNIAICLIEMSRFEEAIQQLEACLKMAPTFKRASEKLVELKAKVGEPAA